MGMYIGPQEWWLKTKEAADGLAISCPEGTILPDGSALICKAGGTAWIVAPCYTESSEPWGNYTACGYFDTPPAGNSNHPEITSINFPVLHSCLISGGFNPADWFVPCVEILQNPGYVCRCNWDVYTSTCYWSSQEAADVRTLCCGCGITSSGSGEARIKTSVHKARAFRCVTY